MGEIIDLKIVLTTKEAADYLTIRGLEVAEGTLANWRAQQTYNFHTVHRTIMGRVYYLKSDLDQWLISLPRAEGDQL